MAPGYVEFKNTSIEIKKCENKKLYFTVNDKRDPNVLITIKGRRDGCKGEISQRGKEPIEINLAGGKELVIRDIYPEPIIIRGTKSISRNTLPFHQKLEK